MSNGQRDIDLMLAYDGEGEPVPGLDGDERRKLAGIEEVGELVRGYVELEVDDQDQRLAGLWDRIERRLDDAGEAVAVPRQALAEEPPMGLLQRLAAWFEAHRGHLVTGTVSAAAALLVMVMIQGQNESEGEPTRVQLPPRLVPTMPAAHPVAESTEPEIESLEVYQGSGTILTLPGEGDEVSTQVIWLTPEDAEEKMEGPI